MLHQTASIFLLAIVGLAVAGFVFRKNVVARSAITVALVAVIGIGLSGWF